jgi:hypothetical protein
MPRFADRIRGGVGGAIRRKKRVSRVRPPTMIGRPQPVQGGIEPAPPERGRGYAPAPPPQPITMRPEPIARPDPVEMPMEERAGRPPVEMRRPQPYGPQPEMPTIERQPTPPVTRPEPIAGPQPTVTGTRPYRGQTKPYYGRVNRRPPVTQRINRPRMGPSPRLSMGIRRRMNPVSRWRGGMGSQIVGSGMQQQWRY